MYSVLHIIETALREDIGPGDITTNNLLDADTEGKGGVFAMEPLIVAGLDVTRQVFENLDPGIVFTPRCRDGDSVENYEMVLEVEGNLRVLLAAERTALNFLQHLSGIATHVRTYVDELGDRNVRLVDTRKTTPGWLVLEKYAVRVGGAYNHRMGLYDGVLIKDSHTALCGGIRKSIDRIRNKVSRLIKIEVEASDMDDVREAVEAEADVIMLTNMSIDKIREAVAFVDGKAVLEASGRIRKSDLVALAECGVDIISVGALTQSARCVEMTMQIK